MEQKKPMTSEAKQRVNLRALIDTNKPIWVRNKTGHGYGKRAGNVVFQVGGGDNVDKVVIPPGLDPICITDQVDPESIRNCRDLFKLTSKGVLEVLDPVKADEYYSKHESRKALVEQKIENQKNFVYENSPMKKDDSKPDEEPVKKEAVSGMAIDICLKLKHKVLTAEQAIERLEENHGVFTIDDLSHISNYGVHKEIKAWAKKALKELNENDE